MKPEMFLLRHQLHRGFAVSSLVFGFPLGILALAPFAFVAVGSTAVVSALTRCRIASRSSAIRGEVSGLRGVKPGFWFSPGDS